MFIPMFGSKFKTKGALVNAKSDMKRIYSIGYNSMDHRLWQMNWSKECHDTKDMAWYSPA